MGENGGLLEMVEEKRRQIRFHSWGWKEHGGIGNVQCQPLELSHLPLFKRWSIRNRIAGRWRHSDLVSAQIIISRYVHDTMPKDVHRHPTSGTLKRCLNGTSWKDRRLGTSTEGRGGLEQRQTLPQRRLRFKVSRRSTSTPLRILGFEKMLLSLLVSLITYIIYFYLTVPTGQIFHIVYTISISLLQNCHLLGSLA